MTLAQIPASRILLPGWLNSDAAHWQRRWELLHGYRRIEQYDRVWPRRGDWMARLDEVILESERSAVLVAHSLGCQLVAARAAFAPCLAREGRFLGSTARQRTRRHTAQPVQLATSVPRERLPFASHVVASEDDPFCAPRRAAGMAADWGSELTTIGPRGHTNADSGLGDWPECQFLLRALLAGAT